VRILYARNFIAPGDLGGNGYPFQIVMRLARRSHDVRLVTSSRAVPPGVRLIRYPATQRHPLLTFASHAAIGRTAMARALRGWTPDVIALSSYDTAFGYFWPGALARNVPTAFIYHSRFHSDAVNRVLERRRSIDSVLAPGLARFAGAVQRLPLERSDMCIAVSDFSRAEILGFSPNARVCVVTTGVDVDRFAPLDRVQARQALGLGDEKMLLTVGRLVPVKRYDRAIRALAVLQANSPPLWRLHVVGSGAEESNLRSVARQEGVEGRVHFDGQLDGPELVARYRAADAQLCTSDFENWSLSILEGLACGLPVIGTPTGGTPDLLRMVDERLIAGGLDARDIAMAVSTVIESPDLGAIRTRARGVAMEYSWDRVVERLEAAFGEVISVGRAKAAT